MGFLFPHPNDPPLVRCDLACPVCGERDQDKLVWIDDDTGECQQCGCPYQP